MFNASRTIRTVLRVAVLTLLATSAAEAGPPLICDPFDAGNAPLLPWSTGQGWKTPDPAYDVQRLTADTVNLLAPDAPILARMENMRRATIYAAQNKRIAVELLAAVLGKAAQEPRDPLAWFDAGYLVETYRQAKGMAGWDMLSGNERDGYSFVRKAIGLAGASASSPDMEFAASLMAPRAESFEHRRRAAAGAKQGSLLAKNLTRLSL